MMSVYVDADSIIELGIQVTHRTFKQHSALWEMADYVAFLKPGNDFVAAVENSWETRVCAECGETMPVRDAENENELCESCFTIFNPDN